MNADAAMRPATTPCEAPVLRLGLVGFTREEEAMLCVELSWRAKQRRTSWQVAPLAEADAWFVNGARLRSLPDGTWRVWPAAAAEHSVRIDPGQRDCAVAVSCGPHVAALNPAYRFELDSPESIQAVLEQLEGWLRPLVIQFALASHIIGNEVELATAAYHVTVASRLYAVISRRAGVAVWPIGDPMDLAQAVWHRRPSAADAVPATFMGVGLQEALWQYALRTTRDILPSHYRRKRLYLRLPPPVPTRLIGDGCLLVVRELGRAPGTFQELAQRTGIDEGSLARQLGALFVVGSVTANERRVAAAADPTWNSSLAGAHVEGEPTGPEMTVRLRARRAAPAEDELAAITEVFAGMPADADERSSR
jgi:hypothetical protein